MYKPHPPTLNFFRRQKGEVNTPLITVVVILIDMQCDIRNQRKVDYFTQKVILKFS